MPRERLSHVGRRLLVAGLTVMVAALAPIAPPAGAQQVPSASSPPPPDSELIASDGSVIDVPDVLLDPEAPSSFPGDPSAAVPAEAPPVPPGATSPPYAGLASTSSVIGADGRSQVNPTTGFPNRAVGQVNFRQRGSSYICSGYLIDENTVVTSGHCVHTGPFGSPAWSTDVVFTPGRNNSAGPGQTAPYGSCNGVTLVSTPAWVEDGSEYDDYGFIQLDCTVGDVTGWFGFGADTDTGLDGAAITVAQYPGDKPSGTQWTMSDTIREVGDEMLFYRADTAGGSSGSPVYRTTPGCGGSCYAAGAVHSYGVHGGSPHSGNNHGPRITYERAVHFSAVGQANSCTGNPFSDVPLWVEPAVDWVSCNNIMAGYANNTFRPDSSITRAQVARLIYRLQGSPPVDGLPAHGLSDVPPWVEDAVRWMVANDYATGYPGGTFEPNDPITRAEVSRMLFRVEGLPSGSPAHGFSDVPEWVEDAVDWITDPGRTPPYATGYDDGTYRPDDPITRAQTTRMTCRIAGHVEC